MKLIKLLFVSTFILFVSTAQANGEFLGPAFRVDEDFGCETFSPDYVYTGTYFIQYSNGKKGHATYKCIMDGAEGDSVILHFEYAADGFPIPGGDCYNSVDLEGDRGMWTAQCFGVWYELE